MRAAARLFASVKEGKFLESGAPTGLTGLLTHPSPRSTLVYLYCSTLDKLKEIPESSVYRQATQALTQHRLQIIEAAKPAGYRAWQERIQYLVDENPRAFEVVETSMGSRIRVKSTRKFVDFRLKKSEWDGEKAPRFAEGPRTATQRASVHPIYGGGKDYQAHDDLKEVTLDPEPQLTAEQISEVESQIGAGLIEEVIQVAEGEHKLVDEMVKAKVWEELEEKEPEGQWIYFERGGHTKTQAP